METSKDEQYVIVSMSLVLKKIKGFFQQIKEHLDKKRSNCY